jgi:hypothetical protein
MPNRIIPGDFGIREDQLQPDKQYASGVYRGFGWIILAASA